MYPYQTYRFSPSFKWPILALKGCAALSSTKSCFCAVVCPSHLVSSFLVMVKMEVGKYLLWVSQCDSAWWWLPLSRLPRIPAHPAHILLGTLTHFHRHLPQAHLLVMSLSLIIVTLKFHVQKLLYKAFKELLIAFQEQYIHSFKNSPAHYVWPINYN